MRRRDRFLGCLLGLAAGDAVGTTVEFRPRGDFEPLTDMVLRGGYSAWKRSEMSSKGSQTS